MLLFRLFIPYVTTHFACVGNPLRACENYLLFYVVREDESAVYVIRFLYAKRAWQNILREYVKKEGGGFMPVFTTIYVQEDVESMGSDILI